MKKALCCWDWERDASAGPAQLERVSCAELPSFNCSSEEENGHLAPISVLLNQLRKKEIKNISHSSKKGQFFERLWLVESSVVLSCNKNWISPIFMRGKCDTIETWFLFLVDGKKVCEKSMLVKKKQMLEHFIYRKRNSKVTKSNFKAIQIMFRFIFRYIQTLFCILSIPLHILLHLWLFLVCFD